MSRAVNLGVFWGWILTTELAKPLDLRFGSPRWTRTINPAINSRMLCQLSYRGRCWVPEPAWRAGCGPA